MMMASYTFASALEAVVLNRKRHAQQARRLRLLAADITTPAVKTRVLYQAQEHAVLAGLDPTFLSASVVERLRGSEQQRQAGD